jgi:hypothetical protein
VFCWWTSEILDESILLLRDWFRVPLFLSCRLWPTFSLANLIACYLFVVL